MAFQQKRTAKKISACTWRWVINILNRWWKYFHCLRTIGSAMEYRFIVWYLSILNQAADVTHFSHPPYIFYIWVYPYWPMQYPVITVEQEAFDLLLFCSLFAYKSSASEQNFLVRTKKQEVFCLNASCRIYYLRYWNLGEKLAKRLLFDPFWLSNGKQLSLLKKANVGRFAFF